MTTAKKDLQQFCEENTSRKFCLHSRAHKMQKTNLYIKRDDELPFGTKLRKYASVLPFLQKNKEKRVGLIGSVYSNHILSFLQLLRQEGFKIKLFLEKPKTSDCKGNYFFLSLLLKPEETEWIENSKTFIPDKSLIWIPMGACMKEAFAGALTLALDILENEDELQTEFAHVFIDAGTALSAIALILGFSFLQKKSKIHVVLMAGSQKDFGEKLIFYHNYLESSLKKSVPFPLDFALLEPCTAKSFGSVNQSVLQCITKTAQSEGILLDPIYTSKLLLTAQKMPLEGPTLWIHSGGVSSLTGFQEPLIGCVAD